MKVDIAALNKMTDKLLAYGPSKKNAAKEAKKKKKAKKRHQVRRVAGSDKR